MWVNHKNKSKRLINHNTKNKLYSTLYDQLHYQCWVKNENKTTKVVKPPNLLKDSDANKNRLKRFGEHQQPSPSKNANYLMSPPPVLQIPLDEPNASELPSALHFYYICNKLCESHLPTISHNLGFASLGDNDNILHDHLDKFSAFFFYLRNYV